MKTAIPKVLEYDISSRSDSCFGHFVAAHKMIWRPLRLTCNTSYDIIKSHGEKMALFFFVTSMNQNENGKGSIVTKTTSFQMLLVSLLVTLKGG